MFECQHPVRFYRTEKASLIPRAEAMHNCIIIWSTRDTQCGEHELKIPEMTFINRETENICIKVQHYSLPSINSFDTL